MLIHRLETYTWRDRESHLNSTLPQFRTAITVPHQSRPLRLHFIHFRSPQPGAISLLLLPSFPLTNLSLPLALLEELKNSGFNVVLPSLPGLGFSDAFTSDAGAGVLEKTAAILNQLMVRLGYDSYLVSATGSGMTSPANIDYFLPALLAERYAEHCLGVHVINPCAEAPETWTWAWLKFKIAEFFHADAWGYQVHDFHQLKQASVAEKHRKVGGGVMAGRLGLREPNTLAYALCDSPVGLLGLVASALNRRGLVTGRQISDEDVIDLSMLAWLPGPEAGMRFWADAAWEVQILKKQTIERRSRSRAAISILDEDVTEHGFVPLVWAGQRHDVLWSKRVAGQMDGLVDSKVILEGVQALARIVAERDLRLKEPGLNQVVVRSHGLSGVVEEEIIDSQLIEADSPDTVVALPFGSFNKF